MLFGTYSYKKIKSDEEINLFAWYIGGQLIFLIFPYIFITLTNLDFRFYISKRTELIGVLILLISNAIVYITYMVFPKNIIKNNIKVNRFINRIFIFLIYAFVLFSAIFCIKNILDIGIQNITNNMILRSRLSILGPFAIILMFPLGLSTYYWIKIIDGEKSHLFHIKTILITVIALIVAFFRGQRTDLILVLLLPLLYLFNKRKSIRYLLMGIVILVVFSAVYAMTFKVNVKYLNIDFFNVIKSLVSNDFDRNWTYWMAINYANPFSNDIMWEPYSGYIYTLFTFIPRKLASFKGYSTESWFVFFMGNEYVSEWRVNSIAYINWGITLSNLTEALINGGYIAVILLSIFTGIILKVMESMTSKYKYLCCCLPFTAALLSGYTFYNIIIIYSPIIFTLVIMHKKEEYKNIYDRRDIKYGKKSFDNYGSL